MATRSPKPDSSRSTTSPTPSPYRSMLPAQAEIEEDPLRLRLDFHGESVALHDFDRGVVRTKLVSALDVAHALARELDLDTGLLPPDALWWAKTASGIRVTVWREPRVWTVRLRERYDAKPRRVLLPMPGVVFICLPGRQAPYAFAARERPHAMDDQLYHCPTYNVFTSGRVCTGSHPFPADPAKVPEAFFESYFSVTADTGRGKSQRHPEDIGELWAELKGKPIYPLDDLVPHMPVADAMRIGE
jgi:Prokaryotic E2 family D